MNKTREIVIRVPATSANLGPGFDVAGLAVTCYNTFLFRIEESDAPCEHPKVQMLRFADEFSVPEDNYVYTSFAAAMDYLNSVGAGRSFSSMTIECVDQQVPTTRGLGSSSTCIVAGVSAAFALVGRSDDKAGILQIATRIEGHPDNVAPAIYGGVTLSVIVDGTTSTMSIAVKNHYVYLALVPPFQLSTHESRAVLPKEVSREVALSNAGHLAWLIRSLETGYDQGLRLGLLDSLHQPYRSHLIPGYDEVMALLWNRPDVLGAYLSGAGPTIMAIMPTGSDITSVSAAVKAIVPDWDIIPMILDLEGVRIKE